ncbi:MAG: energy transducer TonB [Porphyrobacter sp.]|nr:energy transducer TonB [Porphyrobacter sp.]
MAERALQHEEKIGLGIAVLLHGALVAVLLQQAVRTEVLTFPERMEVSLVSEVGLESASREPVPESQQSIAPELGEAAPPPDTADPAPPPPVTEQVQVAPPPPQPKPSAKPSPKPSAKPSQQPSAKPSPKPSAKPSAAPATRSTPAPRATTAARSGGSRIGDDFLEGKGSSATTTETRAPAATFGAADRAALASAITRQIRPHWNAPSGVDAEKLVSIVSWDLNRDGTLKGRPRCRVEQSSITDSNQPQASLHCERAIRAVSLAAPFDLPDQFYDRWKALEWQFDRRL